MQTTLKMLPELFPLLRTHRARVSGSFCGNVCTAKRRGGLMWKLLLLFAYTTHTRGGGWGKCD